MFAWARSRSRIGRTNAAVLPVPVWAAARTSRPSQHERDRCGLDGRRGFVAFLGHHLDEIGREAERCRRSSVGSCVDPVATAGMGRRDGGRRIVRSRVWGTSARAARSIAEIGGAPVRLTRSPPMRMSGWSGSAGALRAAILRRRPPKARTRQTGTTEDRRPHGRNPVIASGASHLTAPDRLTRSPARTVAPQGRAGAPVPRASRPPLPLAAPPTVIVPPHGVPAGRRQESCRSPQAAPSGRPPLAGSARLVRYRSWPSSSLSAGSPPPSPDPPPPPRPSRSSSSSAPSSATPRDTSVTAKCYAALARSPRRPGRRDLQPERHLVAGQDRDRRRQHLHLPRPRQRLPQPVWRLPPPTKDGLGLNATAGNGH